MHHPLHKRHPLTLLTNTDDYTCDVCNQEHYYPSFAYRCSEHKWCFMVDLKCATTWLGIIENHHHKFRLSRRKDMEFNCDVCGMKGSNTVYICSICQLLVHKYCTSLPGHVRTRAHPHPLMLRWSVERIIYTSGEVCKLCYTNMDKSRGFYYCEPCRYIAHNTCAVKESIGDDDEIGASKADVAQQQITSGDLQDKIKHFSHQQHFLTLIIGHHEEVIIRCAEEEQQKCHFFLHTNCARLPSERLHPFHPQHPLILLSKAPSIDGVFECDMCNTLSQGFVYSCEKCNFYLDLQCNLLPDSLEHKAHYYHPLILNKGNIAQMSLQGDLIKEKVSDYCLGCGCQPVVRFSCFLGKDCPVNFHCCIRCVKLPVIARHKYVNHPLKLTYERVTDDVGYCEICEGKRDPKHWFYRCGKCDFDFHSECVLERYPQIKLGSSYKHDAHPQPVTLVDKIKSVIPKDKRYKDFLPCELCGEPCQGLVYECSECNINIHRKGCCHKQ
ncbi:uncharacterized protein LOC110769568 [Prunus avium]|uniref:Uncharacterized protein LOC110769568 n=1 Tax=Prunus avium TaxID=42229 RepID=A0A6P5TQK4_PRUAV|nr:uncharacterized protein LOC110769568 [Prunus avium]